MANRALDRSLADFITGALCPPLIMALVGSLVFFLLEVVYEGFYHDTLQWVLFFFVFGVVLIARISMNSNLAGRAGLYGFFLGGAVFLAMQTYVDYSQESSLAPYKGFVNLGLIALIWWSAHRLTWDCTLLDDTNPGEGAGLLDAAGLERDKGANIGDEAVTLSPPLPAKATKKSKKLKPEEEPGLFGWWERYRIYREKKIRKPGALGVWVVFFSLAALPLFGLGQAFIPVEATARREYAFSLLIAYVGSGLGLLLATNFLSLRHYLRQRKVTMPLTVTAGWLSLGVLLIVLHLFASTLLPRPVDPQPLWDWTGLTVAVEKTPAPFSPFREKGTEEEGEKGRKGEEEKTEEKEGKKGEGEKAEGEKGEKGEGRKGQKEAGKGQKDKSGSGQQGAAGPKPRVALPPVSLPALGLGPLAVLLKVIVVAVIVVIVVIILARAGLHFLANFTDWARRLLAFFEKFKLSVSFASGPAEPPPPPPMTYRSFASYASPFGTGKEIDMSPGELVRYSFAALHAWGREQNLARSAGETALEFARRIGAEYPGLGHEAVKLAALYARLAYSTDTLSEVDNDKLRDLWERMSDAKKDEGMASRAP